MLLKNTEKKEFLKEPILKIHISTEWRILRGKKIPKYTCIMLDNFFIVKNFKAPNFDRKIKPSKIC